MSNLIKFWALPCAALLAAAGALAADRGPWESSYRPVPSTPTLLRNATVLIGNGERLDGADVLLVDGRIEQVGQGLRAPAGAREVDASGSTAGKMPFSAMPRLST